MRLRVVDFETTGAQGSEVIEAGVVDLERSAGGWGIRGIRSQFFKPCGPVSAQARAVHHIPDGAFCDAMPANAETLEAFLRKDEPVHAYVAHHAEFERSFLPTLSTSTWICTVKAARRAWPQAPGHSNQVLRYWLGLDLEPTLALPAHRAGPDAFVTAHILQQLLETETVETLVEWTTQPVVVSFDKYKIESWCDVPFDYLQRMLSEN